MQDKEKDKKYWRKLLRKYRFVIMTDSSFEEKMVAKLSRLNILIFLGVVIIGCFFCTLLLFTYTPLNEYIPGKSSGEVQKNLIQISLKSDSLQKSLDNRGIYLQRIHDIISGGNIVVTQTLNTLNTNKEGGGVVFKK